MWLWRRVPLAAGGKRMVPRVFSSVDVSFNPWRMRAKRSERGLPRTFASLNAPPRV
jgi:hypothetical protein